MECLVTRKAKYQYVLENGHLFGDKHGCYFNPYSKACVNEQNCKHIEKLQGFQVGCGGPGSKPWFELIGLCDDYDMALDGLAHKALVLYHPQTLDLKPGQKLTYKNYGSQKQTQINNYMYKHHKFLYHFCNESGDDSWAIDAMCAGYLASNSAYTRSSKNAKAALFLKCNASDPNSKGLDEDLDIGGEDQGRDKDESGKEDDYNLNAHCYNNTQTASKPQPASCSLKQPHPSYGATQPTKKARHLTCDEGNDKDNNEDDKDWLSSQPQPCLLSQPPPIFARPTRKGKGKERKDCPLIPRPKPICCKEANVEDNNKDNKDNKPVQQIYKSIWHVNSMLSLPDTDPKPVQQLAQQVPKSICQVNSTPSSSDANPKPVAEPKKGISSCTKGVKAAEKDMVKR
ncbi:hypothetical protein RHS01_10082 [Rhizoctonia solani]|uniref:Uncharacterized protein n=1 Tax=Rhizoctonia solani TaxID=456999 RepID=A0A8H7M2S7_9AGAM|nr:hypothetical protein RHS01_10082 [Rhizoctonia solani]